jgi:hypothetical protein
VRRVPAIHSLRIASTGPFTGTETAARDQRAARLALAGEPRSGRRLPELWRFSDPVGRRAVAGAASPDLAGFGASHLVHELSYLEPREGALARAMARVVARSSGAGFAVAARAFAAADAAEPAAELEVSAPDVVALAAALAAGVTAAIAEGKVPAGLSLQREALSPAVQLVDLEKRGARVRFSARA